MTKPLLEVHNLRKVFKKADGSQHVAVDDISFHLETGEIFSFLGPNGAGKSTTINMITTQLTPTSGTIKIAGRDIRTDPINARRKIGIVAQYNNLDRGLTAFENLVYHGRYFGMTTQAAEQRANELLADFGLSEWRQDYVKSFSGGMAQRLKIARAIMHRPQLLFLDEPTTGLDPAYREILWDHVLRLNRQQQTTVFLTTHYMEEPERFSDHVAIYQQGKIRALGTIPELRQLVPAASIVYATVDAVTAPLLQELNQQPFIKEILQKDEKNLAIFPNTDDQILQQVLPIFEQQPVKLENIRLSFASLDDIFVHVTEHPTEMEVKTYA